MAVVTCVKCGTKNRVDGASITQRRPVCAKCGTALNEAASDKGISSIFRKGDAIGPYTLVHCIGHGGFGEVWLGEKSGIITSRFALKLPKSDDIDSAIFKNEASVWLQASGHTNIVPIIEADVQAVRRAGNVIRSDQVVIVSEYLRDGSLQKRLEEHTGKTLSIETAVETALGILAGLKYLHTRQPRIIHRDLKPDNVLLQGDTPRLTDFGIARMLKTQSYSRTEQISGTLPYMAPEVFKGQYSVRTDIWAVGVILFQLLSGRLPFPQTEIAPLLWAIAHDEPKALPAHVPGPLRTVVFQTLKKDPQERYQSADLMRQALIAAKSGQGNWQSTIPAPPPPFPAPPEPTPPVPEPAPKPFARASWIVAAVVVLLTALGFVSYLNWKGVTASDNSNQATSNTNAQISNSLTNDNSALATASVDTSPIVATGVIDFETKEEPFNAPTEGRITRWLVRSGDLVTQPTVLVNYTYFSLRAPTVEQAQRGQTVTHTLSSSISAQTMQDLKQGLIQVISITEGADFKFGQELCRIARILHVRVGVKLSSRDIGRITVGSNARFQTASQMVFRGRVEFINAAEGNVTIKLFDEDAFESRGYLNQITPKMTGDVIFDVNNGNR